MKRDLPPFAVVSLPALDLRRRPDHRSELRSQLLMGEHVRVLRSAVRGQWWRVENQTDAYSGWVRNWGLVGCSGQRARRWLVRARSRIVRLYAEVRTEPGRGAMVSPVFWNGRVISGRIRGRHRRVELPDGRRGWIAVDAMGSTRTRTRIVDRVRDLLGVPYLWGGRSPLGFDCSALTQQLFIEHGITLPRDAHDQYLATCRHRVSGPLESGDLMFFGSPQGRFSHVAVALGGGLYAHARGRVRINSIEPGNPLFDNELTPQLRASTRPPWPPSARRSRGS